MNYRKLIIKSLKFTVNFNNVEHIHLIYDSQKYNNTDSVREIDTKNRCTRIYEIKLSC